MELTDGIIDDDVVDERDVTELGKAPKEVVEDVVAMVIWADDVPKESDTGAALVVAREVPKLMPAEI